MSGARFVISKQNAAGADVALANDPDPNATQPDPDRIYKFGPAPQTSEGVWIGASGGGPTVRLWMRVKELAPPTAANPRWIALGAAFAIVVDEAVVLAPGVLPQNIEFFVQVTANGGVHRIALGNTQS